MERINVTKSFLPPKEEYQAYLSKIWEASWLTNNGPLVVELEDKISKYLNSQYFSFVGNGTIALQIAIKALELEGEIITTPFSYCATTTSIIWENLEPVFVDINPQDLNINADLIEAAITEKTSGILATHVYEIHVMLKNRGDCQKYNLKVIYDAAHAFGVEYKGKSLLEYGDISTCSFHSTKVFHTVEGGSINCHSEELHEKVKLLRSFGHILDNYYVAGINGKNSEFHAAMGLCNLNHLSSIISGRKRVFRIYDNLLNWNHLEKPTEITPDLVYNFAYYPVVLENTEITAKIMEALNKENIYPRRYFYPSLNQLKYLNNYQSCPVSEDISCRVLSLPLYPDLEDKIVENICEIINSNL